MTCGLVHDSFFEKHLTGHGHPERPERTSRVYKEMTKAGLIEKVIKLEAQPCKEDYLELAHDREYLTQAKRDIEQGLTTLTTGDTQICKKSWEVARLATGGVLHAVHQVAKGKIDRAFCLTRPPGHHATPGKGMGFCIFNHVALAARYAQKELGIGKVLIVDWDVHHGNGTQDVFYEDETVFFLSTHQSPWYPGTGSKEETGKGKGLGYTVNFPLPAGSGRSEIVEGAFGLDLTKKIKGFRPELILISAGFDSRRGDPLGQFRLQDKDFADLTRLIVNLANEHCGGKVVSVLEGGYDLDGLAKASLAHFSALQED
jgi:acetoin utilization deacetylase AcuC-like enzyme